MSIFSGSTEGWSLGAPVDRNILDDARQVELLKGPDRINAYQAIGATPPFEEDRIELKKGVVGDTVEGHLVDEAILRDHPLVYLGARTDVAYPLALGGRKIILVDYTLKLSSMWPRLVAKIKGMIGRDPEIIGKNILRFNFDFGNGPEEVEVTLDSSMYRPPTEELTSLHGAFVPPEKIGMVLCFASGGPMGPVVLDEETKRRIVPGGYILKDNKLSRIDPENMEEQEIKKW